MIQASQLVQLGVLMKLNELRKMFISDPRSKSHICPIYIHNHS